MFGPDKSTEEILLEVAVTTLVFAALLFLLGLKAEGQTASAGEPSDSSAPPQRGPAKILVMPRR